MEMSALEVDDALDAYERIYSLPETADYDAALEKIHSINKALKSDGIWAPSANSFLGVKRLYNYLGCPIDSIPVLHVAGTNGKGSTSLKLAKSLNAAGINAGLFVSPHIACFRERMQLANGELVSEEEFVLVLNTVFEACRACKVPATEFEVAFLMSTVYFQRQSCDAAVLEVGLGGEVDATNVVTTSLSIICSISYDHTRILGSTLELICDKKAGIFKPSVPALIGPNVPELPAKTRADAVGAILTRFDDAVSKYSSILQKFGVTVSESMDTDMLNAALSLLGLCLVCDDNATRNNNHDVVRNKLKDALFTPESSEVVSAVATALQTRPPCRWEKISYLSTKGKETETDLPTYAKQRKIEFVLDMGHNPAAIRALCERVTRDYSHRRYKRLVCGMSRDKDVGTCLHMLSTVFNPSTEMYFVQAPYWRAASVAELAQLLRDHKETAEAVAEDKLALMGDVSATLQLVVNDLWQTMDNLSENTDAVVTNVSDENTPVVIVCGSGYIMPDTKAFLGIKEPRDTILH